MLTDDLRKRIVKRSKQLDGWYDGEVSQDEIIRKECIKFGYTLADFYNTDGNFLNKILS
ncbi:MAG: hypothetical protein ACOCVF_03910 [bacterium]